MEINIIDLMNEDRLKYIKHNGLITIVYEDGVKKKLTPGELTLERFIFELIKRSKYKVKYLSKYSITNFFVNGLFSSGTVNNMLESIMVDLIVEIGINNKNLQAESLELNKIMFEIVNDIFNILYAEFGSGIMSINIQDLLELSTNKKVLDKLKEAQKEGSANAIFEVHETLNNVIMSKENMHNPMARLYTGGIVNKGQAKQLLGVRGFITEIDSTIFRYPVLNSFTNGLSNLYEMAIESRSAAFALTSSTSSIKQSENLSRELQLGAMYLERIHPGDCGTDKYVQFYVTPPSSDYKGDLPNLIGAYYKLNPEDELKILTMKDTHVIGKNILLRNVLKCNHPDKHGCCSVCFGGLAFNVPVKANIGHLTTTNMSAAASQALLSTKHIIGSAVSGNITLDEITAKIFEVRTNGYSFRKEIFKKADSIKMLIPQEQCNGLKEVKNEEMLSKINFEKLSLISELTIVIETAGEVSVYPCTIVQNGRMGSLTKKLLQFIVKNGIKIDENDNVVLDITKFRSTAIVIKLQEKEYSFYTLIKEIRSKIKTRSVLKGGKSSETPEELLSSLFMIVNSKLNINIANLSGLLYTYMARELEKGNYDLGRGSEDPQLISLIDVIDRRSASAALGYNAVAQKIFKPHMFNIVNKPDHPLDALYFKRECIDRQQNNKYTV